MQARYTRQGGAWIDAEALFLPCYRPGVRPALVAIASLLALCVAVPAFAGHKHDKGKHSDKPWADGVSKADQDKANSLFEEGNKYFEQSKYTEALERFEQAIKLWDHPNIEYNKARCLIKMKRTREAYEAVQKALQYGGAPLGDDFRSAKEFRETLEGSLAMFVITTTQDGVKVELDGRTVMEGAGKTSERVEAGPHQLVVSMKGFETDSRAMVAKGGETITQEITLDPAKVKIKREVVNYERRWPYWVPWGTVGGGIALGLIGIPFFVAGTNLMTHFNNQFLTQCPAGCAQIPANLKPTYDRALRDGHVATGFFVVGSLAVGAGLVLAYLNRPHKIEEHPKIEPDVQVTQHGVTAGFTFTFD